MGELNAVIGVSIHLLLDQQKYIENFNLSQQQRPDLPRILQQMHAQQIPGQGAPPMPLGMPHPSLPGALGGPLGLGSAPSQHPLSILNKQELHRPEETKSNSGLSVSDVHRNSISPPTDREKYRNIGHERPRSPSEQHDLKKVKKEDKDMGHVSNS